MKDSFIFHKEWRDAISGLPPEVRLEVYDAIVEYGISGTLVQLKPMAMLAFNFVKAAIDKDNERDIHVSEVRKKAARKRWDSCKCMQNMQMHANASFALQKETEKEEKEIFPPAPPIKEKENKEKENFNHDIIARMCAYAGDLQSEVADMLHDSYWCEQVCMYFHLKLNELPLLLKQFVGNCQIGGMTSHRDIQDAKRHFRDWLIKKQSKQDARPYNNSTKESRAVEAAEIIARLAAAE